MHKKKLQTKFPWAVGLAPLYGNFADQIFLAGGGYFSLPPPGIVLHQSGGIFQLMMIPLFCPPFLLPPGVSCLPCMGNIKLFYLPPVFKRGGKNTMEENPPFYERCSLFHLTEKRNFSDCIQLFNVYTNLNNVFINSFMHTFIYCKCMILILIHTTIIVFSFR